MLLNDGAIAEWLARGKLEIGEPSKYGEEGELIPLPHDQIQPASVDLRLDDLQVADAMGLGWRESPEEGKVWHLAPGQFVLGSTMEVVGLPDILAGRVEGKSTWGRRGLMIHAAGFVDPGFRGQITLELKNLTNDWLQVKREVRICQIAFNLLNQPCMRPYGTPGLGSHYQGQMGVTPAWT